ncbi:WD40/YVTN/BNR-like repeat-containing protein, partial [Caldisericum sp. AR60]|uniref:WD40/YVTN/BNR-like repeat-containing protein n=1 Tax=Caldisericum sp. AR60 TaxID=3397852 RepID=UPI0039FD74A7
MLRKKLMVSIFVILILSVYAGCRRTEGILPQNNSQSEIPNQEVEIKNSEKEQFVPWQTSHWERINDGIVTAFAIDPKDSNILYAATYPPQKADSSSKLQVIGNAKTTLWKSEDGGKHWSILISLENLRYGPPTIDGIHIDPECSRNIWISEHGAGLLFSSDGGVTWKKDLQKDEKDIFRMYWNSLNTNINDLPVAYNVRFGDTNRWTGVIYSSLDSGKKWKRISLPPLTCPNFILAVNKKNPNIFYVFGLNGLFK